MIRPFIALSLAGIASSAIAVPLECYRDPSTDAMQCVAPSEVRETAPGIRSAPLYSGGPKSMRKTAYTIDTNCVTAVTHLKDRAGVSFAGGDGNETRAVRELRKIVCDAPLKKSSKR